MDIQIKVGVLVTERNRILLLKEWSDSRKGYLWNIIKGTYDASQDKTIIDCAKREAKEEAGIGIKIEKFISCSLKYGFNIRIYFNFVGKIVGKGPVLASLSEQKGRNENIIETRWFTKKEAIGLKEKDFVNDVVYEAIQCWIKDIIYPLKTIKEYSLKN